MRSLEAALDEACREVFEFIVASLDQTQDDYELTD